LSEERKQKILNYLREHGKKFVKEIATGTGMSPSTVSKYLLLLLSEGKIKRERLPPYTYYEAR
jgi:DeoR/GlpR family transcriptional regulator of sugar metabolism